jgi:UDP-2,4-diacetamido-2,4,6-trideoxy-beta-L-altropyranose hydrolase
MKVVLRAEATKSIGSGHVARCLTLGSDLVLEGHDVTLISSGLPPWLALMAERAGVSVENLSAAPYAAEDARRTLELQPDLLIVDGYDFESSYFETIGDAYHVILDDNNETKAISPAAVINVNPHATPEMYCNFALRPKLLIGLRYALIRSEIRDRIWTPSNRYIVSIGGSDVLGLTDSIAGRLVHFGIDISIAHRNSVDKYAHLNLADGGQIEHFEPSDYPNVLVSSGFAIVGAGGSMWETASLGIPSVALVVADNQVGPANAAERLGITCSIDVRQHRDIDVIISKILGIDQSERESMSRLGPEIVDGKGSLRVIEELCG